jgi:hypothetical protein
MIDLLTFRQLDGDLDLTTPDSALEEWYLSVRDTPIREFDLSDLARSCRQELYLEHIIPLCLQQLAEDPLIGELYDGEMFRAVKNAPDSYWQEHPAEKRELEDIAKRGFQLEADPLFILTKDER